MSSVLTWLRQQLRHLSDANQQWDRLDELVDAYGAAAEGGDERARVGALIADIYESVAGNLEASRLVRINYCYTPAELRADAAEWRSGEMYVGP